MNYLILNLCSSIEVKVKYLYILEIVVCQSWLLNISLKHVVIQSLKQFFRYYLSFAALGKTATVLVSVLFIVMNDTVVSIFLHEKQAYCILWSLISTCIH